MTTMIPMNSPGVCTYDDETHSYRVDGRRVPSVTEIVSMITAAKYSDTNAAMLEQAKRRGTEVHELCQAIDCGIDPEELEIPPELVGYVNAYLTFLRDWEPEWDYMEKMVWSGDFAGRTDRIGRIDGHKVIMDIKTTGNMDRLSKLALLFQLHGYTVACLNIGLGLADATLGLQLKKDGRYAMHWTSAIRRKYLPNANVPFLWDAMKEITKMIGGYTT